MSLVVNTVSNSKDAQKDLAKLKDAVSNIETAVISSTDAFKKFGIAITAAFAAAGTVRTLTDFADKFTNIENKIKSVTTTSDQFKRALQGIKDTAIETRSDLNATASLFQKIAINQKEIGINTTDTIRVVSIVAKAMKISGANAQEASAAMQQFGQAVGSGKLGGDELRSIAENAPALLKAIADGMGIAVGKLKKAGEDGKLTTDKILPGLIKIEKEISDKFSKLGVTYGDAFKNISTSVMLLGDAAKKYFMGASAGGKSFADRLNNIALSAARIAKYFGAYMADARASIAMFVIKAILLFEEIWPAVKAVASAIGDEFTNIYEYWRPSLSKAFELVSGWAVSVADVASSIGTAIYEALNTSSLFRGFVAGLTEIKNFVVDIFTEIADALNIEIPLIDVEKFFKNLLPMSQLITKFVTHVERAFFWLYDEVIGHSWIPDLVEGVIFWMKKLLTSPLEVVKKFTSSSNAMFASIAAASVLAFAAKRAGFFKLAITGVIVAVGMLAKLMLSTSSASEKLFSSFKQFSESSVIARTLKQLLGIQDTVPGQIFGTQIDTNAKVGRGPMRNQEVRPMFHDALNALPGDLQVPIFAAVAGTMTLALASAFKNEIVKNVVVSLFTSGALVLGARIIDDSKLKEAFYGLANGFIHVVSFGFTQLLGGNAIKDPFGLLVLLAKFALLFKIGREFLFNFGRSVATAPTIAGRTISTYAELAYARNRQQRIAAQVKELPTQRQNQLNTTRNDYRDRVNTLAAQATFSGGPLGVRGAVDSMRTGYAPVANSAALIGAAKSAKVAFTEARVAVNNLASDTDRLTQNQRKYRDTAIELTQQLQAARSAFLNGIRSYSAGIGGTIGGVAGLQLGSEIAKGMSKEEPAWKKTAVIMATAFTAQFIGAAILGTIAALFTNIFAIGASLIGLAITAAFTVAPFVTGAVLIGAALVGGYLLFKALPKEWKAELSTWFQSTWAGRVTNGVSGVFQEPVKDGAQAGLNTLKMTQAGAPVFAMEFGAKLFSQAMEKLRDFNNAIGKWAPEQKALELKQEVNLKQSLKNEDNIKAFLESQASTYGRYDPFGPFKSPLEPIKRATGGYISGPGTGTSDSIPAMLSNGEYVINAKATRENFGLLSAINNGGMVRQFSSGGYVDNFGAGASLRKIDNTPANLQATQELVKTNKELKEAITPLKDSFNSAFGEIRKLINKNPELASFVDKLETNVKSAFNSVNKPPETPRPYVAPADENTFKTRLEAMSPENFSKEIAAVLGNSGFKGINAEDLAAVQKDPENTKILSSLVSKLKFFNDVSEKRGNTVAGKLAKGEAAILKGAIDDLVVRTIFEGEAPSKYKAPEDATDDKTKRQVFRLRDQLTTISEVFPQIGLAADEFYSMNDSFREKLFNSANDLLKERSSITEQVLGSTIIDGKKKKDRGSKGGGIVAPDNLKEGKSEEDYKKFEESRVAAEETLRKELMNFRGFYKNVKSSFASIGQEISDQEVGVMTADEALSLFPNFEKIKANIKKLEGRDVTPEIAKQLTAEISEAQKAISITLKPVQYKALKPYESIAAKANDFGVSIDRPTYDSLGTNRDSFNAAVNKISGNQLQKTVETDPIRLQELQLSINNDVAALRRGISKLSESSYTDKAYAAGESFAQSVSSSFSSALTNFLRGRADGDKTVFQTFAQGLLNSFSDSVADVFSKGVTNTLFGGSTSSLLEGVGRDLFGMSASETAKRDGSAAAPFFVQIASGIPGVGSPAQGLIPNLFNKAKEKLGIGKADINPDVSEIPAKLEEGLTDAVSGFDMEAPFSSLGTMLTNGFSSLFGGIDIMGLITKGLAFMGFASGGYVSGAGTGTSDSIPAMLSNGEFVMNAKATKQFGPLLNSINSGGFGKFAEGGMISPGIATIPQIVDLSQSAAPPATSQQVINLTITGDVSRQTKSEIYKMLPSIAEGVNSHNREKGYR